MDYMKIIHQLSNEDICVTENEYLKYHTTFNIGGPCDIFITPKCYDDVLKSIKLLREHNVKYKIMGNGSNLLFNDSGFRGAIINTKAMLSNISINNDKITAQSGVSLYDVSNFALKNCKTGVEFLEGIPGSMGGAVVMNAGAYIGEIKDVIVETKYIDGDGNIQLIPLEGHDFGYRKSFFKKNRDCIILESVLNVRAGDYSNIKAIMDELRFKRETTQPLEYPSAGSAFKRPEGMFVGPMIQEAGLKGYIYGGAMVSEKHAGFIINYNNATSHDVLRVIDHIKETIYKKFSVSLDCEVEIVEA